MPSLLRTHFQDRARVLKALATYLMERKEQLYAISAHTGATRSDSWIDIEGGIGTLFAYASIGGKDLQTRSLGIGNCSLEGDFFDNGQVKK